MKKIGEKFGGKWWNIVEKWVQKSVEKFMKKVADKKEQRIFCYFPLFPKSSDRLLSIPPDTFPINCCRPNVGSNGNSQRKNLKNTSILFLLISCTLAEFSLHFWQVKAAQRCLLHRYCKVKYHDSMLQV